MGRGHFLPFLGYSGSWVTYTGLHLELRKQVSYATGSG